MTGNLHFLLLLAFLPFLLLFYFPSSLGHSRSRFNGQGAVWSSLWLDCGSGEHGGCGQLVMWLGVAIIVCVQSECACSQVVLYRYFIVSTVRWMTLLRTVVQKAHTRWGRPAMSCDHHGMSCHVIIVMSRDHRGMSHDMRPSWCHVTIVGCHMTCDHRDVTWPSWDVTWHATIVMFCDHLPISQFMYMYVYGAYHLGQLNWCAGYLWFWGVPEELIWTVLYQLCQRAAATVLQQTHLQTGAGML